MKEDGYILVYGDSFVDYIATDSTNTSFKTYLGGATINVAAGISRIGAPAALITITGDDEVSQFVRDELQREGVNTTYAVYEPKKRISGVYVHLAKSGEREFKNYIDETPNIQVTNNHITPQMFKQASVVNVCSGTMFEPTALQTTEAIVEQAREAGAIIAIDANIRPLRWDSEDVCRDTIMRFIAEADLVKVTDDELLFLTETTTIKEGIAALDSLLIPIVLVTLGEKGTQAILNGEVLHVPTEKITAIDTTGAGDAFMAGILRDVHYNGLPTTIKQLTNCVRFGNKLGALAATKVGALTAMPRYNEVKQWIGDE